MRLSQHNTSLAKEVMTDSTEYTLSPFLPASKPIGHRTVRVVVVVVVGGTTLRS